MVMMNKLIKWLKITFECFRPQKPTLVDTSMIIFFGAWLGVRLGTWQATVEDTESGIVAFTLSLIFVFLIFFMLGYCKALQAGPKTDIDELRERLWGRKRNIIARSFFYHTDTGRILKPKFWVLLFMSMKFLEMFLRQMAYSTKFMQALLSLFTAPTFFTLTIWILLFFTWSLLSMTYEGVPVDGDRTKVMPADKIIA